MPTIVKLGQQAAARLTKQSSTALVRQIAKGVLSPNNIQRAASAMSPGKFRTVKHLGRGQFSLADQVVGNVGKKPGLMVRKLPTHADRLPQQEYGPTAKVIDHYNKRFRRWFGKDPIAPYTHVGDTGGFQSMATAKVKPSAKLTNRLTDLHPGNIGPRGQIIDFGLSSNASQASGGVMSYGRPRIDPSSLMPGFRSSGQDLLGNLSQQPAQMQSAVAPFNNLINNNIRRYWALSPQARTGFMQSVHQQAPMRQLSLAQTQQLAQRNVANASTFSFKPPTPTPGTAFKPYKQLAQGAAGAGALGGASYGAAKLFGQKNKPAVSNSLGTGGDVLAN